MLTSNVCILNGQCAWFSPKNTDGFDVIVLPTVVLPIFVLPIVVCDFKAGLIRKGLHDYNQLSDKLNRSG